MKKILALTALLTTVGIVSEYRPGKSSFSYSIKETDSGVEVCRKGKKFKTLSLPEVATTLMKEEDKSKKEMEPKEQCTKGIELKKAYRKKTGTKCYYANKFGAVVCKTEKGNISATENVVKSCKEGATKTQAKGDIGVLEENGKMCKLSKAIMA